MILSEIFIKKGDMSDDSQTVGNDTCLVSVAEMPVDVLLLCGRSFLSVIGQQTVNSFMRIVTRIVLGQSLCLFKLCVEKLIVVFGDIGFNTCCIKNKILGFLLIDLFADRSGYLYHKVEKNQLFIFSKSHCLCGLFEFYK